MPGSVSPLLLLVAAAAAVAALDYRRLLVVAAADCPLDFSWSNFTLASTACSDQNERSKCCRYVNAIVAVSVARYTNATGTLGVPSMLTDICLNSVSVTLQANAIPPSAITFCGLGPKIRVSYECEGRETILEMLQTPNFTDVIRNCKTPLSLGNSCRRCVNSDIIYLRRLIGTRDNITLNTCRNAAFVALANLGDNLTALETANCLFGVQGLSILPVNVPEPPFQSPAPADSPSPESARAPSQHLVGVPLKKHHHMFQLTLLLGIGTLVTGVAILLLTIFILLICKKSRELKIAGNQTESIHNDRSPRVQKTQEGPAMFRRFSYKEIKRATDNFNSIIGKGEFGIVYKAQFHDGCMAAVKQINRCSEQGEEDFSPDMVLLRRLHHRHLVAFIGYCVEKHERFLIYEYMANGSLKEHLHCMTDRNPLGWQTRIRIAIGVANALEYLHFYCDPPLCHGEIRPSNIFLDGNFLAKVADFGLAHSSKGGAIRFETENTNVQESRGYMDPEYGTTRELTEESDVYSFGVLLLELVSARQAEFDDENLVEWSHNFTRENSRLFELVDPAISDSFNLDQLQAVADIIQLCTQREGRLRPSIRQVLRMLSERLDPLYYRFTQAIEDEKGCYAGGKAHRNELTPCSGDARCHHSSSSTSRSCCSGSFLLEIHSPQSTSDVLSV